MKEKDFYLNARLRKEWSFAEISRSERSELTHSYHKYPAKFIPQLARALIEEYTKSNELIWDPFCGSGTLNLEAFRTKRKSIGTDINPVAVLISKVKTMPLNPYSLDSYCDQLLESIEFTRKKNMDFYMKKDVMNGNLSVLKKWFSPESLLELGHILWLIKRNGNIKFQNFALCAFSSILKRSSYWLNSSVKSQVDPNKNPKPPIYYFKYQIKRMEKINKQFYGYYGKNQTDVKIFRHNAKEQFHSIKFKIDTIITSPPYVVSYDYSDIFRLSTYLLFYQNIGQNEDYQSFRKNFIGTPLRKSETESKKTVLPGEEIINSINDACIKRSLTEYYLDMKLFFKNVRESLNRDGKLIMVVGDTVLRKVKIPNAYLLTSIAEEIGLSLSDVFEREIPEKILPTVRDHITGKFSPRRNNNHSEIYKKEYILVFRR